MKYNKKVGNVKANSVAPIVKKQTSFKSKKTENLAGGQAFTITDELGLVTLMVTSFNKDQFYRTQAEMAGKLANTIIKYKDKEFIAKAAVFTRNEFGMRSITHFVAAVLAHEVKGEQWTKNFYKAVFRRVDDITETVACYLSLYGKPLPNSLKKGIRLAFNKFDAYNLAKYRGEDGSVKLVDVVNMTHPTPTEKNKTALKELIEGKLKQEDTWEALLSAAGSDEKKKAKVWETLLNENKLGYFALLRNLRNIEKQAPKVLDTALGQLINPEAIKGSLVLPFRYFTAYKQLEKDSVSGRILTAISDAADISLNNVPKFEGETLVVLDQSGSMGGGWRAVDSESPIHIGSMFAAALAKANNADVITFGTSGGYESLNLRDSILTIAKKLTTADQGGTNFNIPFEKANKQYNRIIILSDMQGWVGYNAPIAALSAYKRKYKADPIIYSFDLTGYGTIEFPQEKVYCLAGFSDKVFNIMKMLETDRNAFVKKINEVSF